MRERETRFTSHPDTPAPVQYCPGCAQPLVYRQTVLGGVKPPERWDHYECPRHGTFTYRHRTGRLAPAAIR